MQEECIILLIKPFNKKPYWLNFIEADQYTEGHGPEVYLCLCVVV